MKIKKRAWRKVFLFMMLTMSLLTIYAGAHESDPVWKLPEPVCLGEDPNGGVVALQETPDIAGAIAKLHSGIVEMQAKIDISAYGVPADKATVTLLLNELIYNYPDLFALKKIEYYYSTGTKTITTVIPIYNMPSDEYAEARTIYNRELNYIVDLVDKDWTDLQKALFVHDYLAANYEYDLTYTIRDAYRFFVNKTGVCQAYTLTYTAILKELGIEVSYVSSDNINHVWNIVKLNGNWYHVDVTHDDPVDDNIGCASHMNFLRSDNGLEGHDKEGEKRDWIYGINERCTDTTYDTYFWTTAYSPFTNVDGTWYFIESDVNGNVVTASRLMKWDEGNGSKNVTIVEGFYTPGTGLGYCAGKLYFNTFYELYSYDLQKKSMEKLLTVDSVIYGSRLEKSAAGVFLKYGENQGSTIVIKSYTVDPYKTVAEGGYSYYQNDGSVYIKLDGTSCVAVACYDQYGKMLGVSVFTDAGIWNVTQDAKTKQMQIIAVQNVTQWVAKCAAHPLVV